LRGYPLFSSESPPACPAATLAKADLSGGLHPDMHCSHIPQIRQQQIKIVIASAAKQSQFRLAPGFMPVGYFLFIVIPAKLGRP
jgi:hypothetical protein